MEQNTNRFKQTPPEVSEEISMQAHQYEDKVWTEIIEKGLDDNTKVLRLRLELRKLYKIMATDKYFSDLQHESEKEGLKRQIK